MKSIVSIVLLLASLQLFSQNIYEIAVQSYAESRILEDVRFELFNEQEKIIEQVSKNGAFQFVIKEGDGYLRLKATRNGFIPKIIHFPSNNYPFINEYEIQEIDVVFNRVTQAGDESEIGELRWISAGHKFSVVPVDSSMEQAKKTFALTEKKMGEIYSQSIKNGDDLLSVGQPQNAMMHYEIALLAKAGDEYAISKINEIKTTKSTKKEPGMGSLDKTLLDKINRGESVSMSDIPEGVVFCVQLGAFSSKVDESNFPGISDLFIIEYEDYTRVFSGEFKDPSKAIEHKNRMVSSGHNDAWIVPMKGNTRIGF